MRRYLAYGPAGVLAAWSILASLGTDIAPLLVLLVVLSTAAMIRELRERYRDE